VRTPSARRTGAISFMPGGSAAANRKVKPVAARQSPAPARRAAAATRGPRAGRHCRSGWRSSGCRASRRARPLRPPAAGAGREIEAAGRVAAGADDVDRGRAGRQVRMACERAHRAGKAAHLLRRDALDAQRGQQRPAMAGAVAASVSAQQFACLAPGRSRRCSSRSSTSRRSIMVLSGRAAPPLTQEVAEQQRTLRGSARSPDGTARLRS